MGCAGLLSFALSGAIDAGDTALAKFILDSGGIPAPKLSEALEAAKTANKTEMVALLDAAGAKLNGFTLNGFTLNGFTLNGFTLNGFTLNGFTLNGFTLNGFKWNGFTLNDRHQGVGLNGQLIAIEF